MVWVTVCQLNMLHAPFSAGLVLLCYEHACAGAIAMQSCDAFQCRMVLRALLMGAVARVS
jgi:hypothetical protein